MTYDKGHVAMLWEKVTFTLPVELVRRLEKIPAGKRNMLVKRAVEKELDREAAVAMIKKMKRKTIWKEKHHPNLLTSKDFARYRRMKT